MHIHKHLNTGQKYKMNLLGTDNKHGQTAEMNIHKKMHIHKHRQYEYWSKIYTVQHKYDHVDMMANYWPTVYSESK